jgi:ferrous iron transport protein A
MLDGSNMLEEVKMKTKKILPLSLLSEGETGTVIKLNGGKTFQEKMISMGITKGDIIEVLTGTQGQALLVLIGSTRLALGYGLAHKIEIEKTA